ncbi:MAG: aminotransferase [Thiotrichales bacterium SG8_50]|jgi:stearoyl-CoA desaturase (delta-9 desaturase)|nr:MAG: aminotransferase [Thiotrichales bacterium SG8_50]
MYSGLFHLPWWGYASIALVFTHVTIIAVTIYLHRHQTHRALDLHPVISHFFRFWLWLTTGMVTREWVAVHRKHHAKVETPDDPHSPQVYGIWRVLFLGVFLYVRAAHDRQTLEKYGHGTPDDWIERNLYSRYPKSGVVLMALANLLLFGALPGAVIFAVQMAWIPFWAAGVINGAGHYWGYRNFPVENASTNIVPWGILIGGEELHNNHHAYATSAKLSSRWYEFDIGWMYIRIMEMLGLAHVRHFATIPRIDPDKTACDTRTIETLVHNRYYVLARYTRAVRKTCMQELARLKRGASSDSKTQLDPHTLWNFRRWLRFNSWDLKARRPIDLAPVLKDDPLLQTVYSMRSDLSKLWARSTASTDQLVEQLRDWCRRAEASGIDPLRQFSRDIIRLT